MSLRSKLALFLILVAIIPSVVVIMLFHVRINKLLSENTDSYIDQLIDERAGSINNYLNDIDAMIFNIRTQNSTIQFLQTVTPDNYSDVECRLLTSEITEKLEFCQSMNSNVNYIGVFSLNEGLDVSRGSYFAEVIRNSTSDEIVKEIKRQPQITLCRTFIDTFTGKPYLLLFDGIINRFNETVLGYIAVKINIYDYFNSIFDKVIQEYNFAILDNDRNILYATDNSLFAEILEDRNEIVHNGDMLFSAERKINLPDWKLIVLADAAYGKTEMHKTTVLTLSLVGIFALFTLGGAYYFIVKIYSPIKQLTDMMNDIDEDVLRLEAPITGKDELGQLGYAFNELIHRVNIQVEEIAQNEKQKNELEVKALQSQITPHFLYNTLNAIKCMARMKKTEDIAIMSESLIDLLRVISSNEKMISLGKEIEYVKAYCNLMSLRSGNKYEIESRIAEDALLVMLPKLSLQPLVENSIIHGIKNDHDSLKIIITANILNNALVILISDNGCGIPVEKLVQINGDDYISDNSPQHLSGIGINNVRKRLKLEFGEGTHITLSRNKDCGTDVEVIIPLK